LALASTSAFAITSSAQAELGPNAAVAGDVRVTPAGTLTADGLSVDNPLTPAVEGDGLNQPAPVIALGANDQPGANAQIRIHNQWRSGDRVLFQVRDSAGNNCASVPTSLGYSAAPTVVSSAVAYSFLSAPVVPQPVPAPVPPLEAPIANSPMADNGLPNSLVQRDVPVVSTGPQIKPEFQVNLLSSTQCAPNGVKDIVEILFTNQSADPAAANYDVTDSWVLSMSGIKYNVGASVTAGPVRNLPLAQNATATPGIFTNTPGGWFGGNLAAIDVQPLVQNMWTNTAFILPVTLAAETPGALVADGFTQDLGTITLAESLASSLVGTAPDNLYQVCYSSNIGSLSTGVPITATGPVVPGSISVSGNCINFRVAPSTGVDTIVFSNIFGSVNSAGATDVSLQDVPDAFVAAYLTPTDNAVSNSLNSDVNGVQAPYLVTPLAIAEALPDRIGGSNRFETASKIAFSTTECSDFVVLVNGNSFPDSLSASYLAGALTLTENKEYGEVPILTTRGTSLHPAAELAIRELGVRTVYIVGGTAAVSADVAAAVDALPRTECGGDISDTTQTVQVERVAGANRYLTNQQVVQRAQSILDSDSINYNQRIRYQANAGEASVRTALMASGADFADALSAGPISFGNSSTGFPLVLTTPNTLSPVAASTLTNLDIERVVIVGGEAAVSADVVASLEALGIDVIRLAGANRYETAIQVLVWAATPRFPNTNPVLVGGEGFNLGLQWNIFGNVVLARGDDFADALAVAPYVGSRQDLLVLTTPTSLHPAAGGFISLLTAYKAAIPAGPPFFGPYPGPGIVAIGLGEAISGDVLDEANALANP
jgi:putative cell wall-binding protein